MEVDKMFSGGLDVSIIRKSDIFFLEYDIKFLSNFVSNCVLIKSAKYLGSFASEWEFEYLSFESFLDFKGLLKSYSGLILGSFFIGFDFFDSIRSEFSGKSFWYEGVSSLGGWYFDNSSFSADMSYIL